MTSDSVSSFLDLARDHGLLPREQVDDLFREPDMPQRDLPALCTFLEKRGVLTSYQAEKIRNGQEQELTFAGYPILGEYGPCPGGTAFKASHPSLRTPLLIRRLRADWLAPADNVSAYVQRAQAAAPVTHPNLAHLLDAGVSQDEAFVVLEPFDGGDLESLIADIGPMPANLAAEYAKQVALALSAAHARGIFHGDLKPSNLVAGPIVASSRTRPDGTLRMRPSPKATVKLMELGLTPLRPGSTGEYFPPERESDPAPTAAGDVYMLGACLYYLLTAKSPAEHAPLAALRPDIGAPFIALIEEMTATNPVDRPSIRHCVVSLQALAKGQNPPPRSSDSEEVKLTQAPGEVELVNLEPGEVELVGLEHEPAPAEFADISHEPYPTPAYGAPHDYWGQPAHAPAEFVPSALDHSHAHAPAQADSKPAAPRVVAPRKSNRKQMYIWIAVGLLLNVVAAPIIWYYVIKGTTEPDPEPYTPGPSIQKTVTPKPKPKKPQGGS